jgi:hypothetical protein
MSIVPSMKESDLWKQVKNALEDEHTHLSRIENTAGTGISDVSACSHGVEVWLELKMFHGNDLHFRNSQRIWISRRLAVGGRVFVLARQNDVLRVYSAASLLLAPFVQHELERKSFHIKWSDLPMPLYICKKPFKWPELRSVIFEPR